MLRLIVNTKRPSRPLIDARDKKQAICCLILFAVFVSSTACPSVVGAADEPKVIYLESGAVAPFSGDLFPPTRSVRLALELEMCMERAAIEIQYIKQIVEIETQAIREAAGVELTAEQDRLALFERRLAVVDAWYRTPVFVAAVTFGLTLAFGATVAYIWGQLTP